MLNLRETVVIQCAEWQHNLDEAMTPTIAIIAFVVVLIVGVCIAFNAAWREWQRPFFRFDEDKALREAEELLRDANKPQP